MVNAVTLTRRVEMVDIGMFRSSKYYIDGGSADFSPSRCRPFGTKIMAKDTYSSRVHRNRLGWTFCLLGASVGNLFLGLLGQTSVLLSTVVGFSKKRDDALLAQTTQREQIYLPYASHCLFCQRMLISGHLQ